MSQLPGPTIAMSGGSSPDILAIAAAFIMHTGARHISFDLTDAQKKLLASPFSKAITMFALFYISTRSIKWTAILIVAYYLVLNMLLNENHPLNVFSPGWLISQGFIEKNSTDQSYTDLYTKNIGKFN
jgi:hypothetical protein